MSSLFSQVIETEDGSLTLRHPDYDEDFHASQGARFEASQLYMQASGFLAYLAHGQQACSVLDVGLGLGYNALMTIESWWHSGGVQDLHLISLEHTRQLVEALRDPQCPWKRGWSEAWKEWSQGLVVESSDRFRLHTVHPRTGRTLSWEIQVGDARDSFLPAGIIDFIWQDAFSPKKNPELWTSHWFAKLKRASRPSVTLVTYSVARVVKDALTEAGWDYLRLRAEGNKKQWLKARLTPSERA